MASETQICVIIILCILNPLCIEGFHADLRKEFYDHIVIYPTIHSENRFKREIYPTQGQYEDKIAIGFTAFDKHLLIDLHMNNDLLPSHYFEKHYKDGESMISHPMKLVKNHCHYQGHIKGLNNSWAAISTCNGLSGVIYDGKELHYIEPDHSANNHSHFLFKAPNMVPKNFKCSGNTFKSSLEPDTSEKILRRHRRSTPRYVPYKSHNKPRIIELIIVNDHEEYDRFNQSEIRVFERSKQIANIVNGLYSPLNISIVLVGVVVWSEHDKIAISYSGDATLSKFLKYRAEHLNGEYPNDNAQLITPRNFDGGIVVSKGLIGPICSYQYSGGINTDHSNLVGLVANTLAHTLGHNLGMEHDIPSCECQDEKCIMAPRFSNQPPHQWSSCSREFLDRAFSRGMDYCLKNRPVHIIGPTCGNGILEDSEECDCGLAEFCDSHCCNATSCRLFPNATCAMGECCDYETCQLKKMATPCRKTVSECDLPEYCDGTSEFCSANTFQQNGIECSNGKAYCYEGKCRSHADQCKLLWGQTSNMSDPKCYEQNRRGNSRGNCGYVGLNETYIPCNDQDILCGRLHCQHINGELEFGMESVSILSRSFIPYRGMILSCRSAIIDLGVNDVDPGLTPNGAKCGNDMVCVNQKCVAVESVKGSDCPNQCSGNGVCNDKGNCHCFRGYSPPLCDNPGPGGSIDSGPASDPNEITMDGNSTGTKSEELQEVTTPIILS